MDDKYEGIISRFLRDDERLVLSEEREMPLVFESNGEANLDSLNKFISINSKKILEYVAKYGAVLFRGFGIASDEDFENTVLSIKGLRGISQAFMAEEGRIHAGKSKFVLHTNAVYKTGGTLYLGGFHSENYYSSDVPAYISFCCLEPSLMGGETGIINMEKVYQRLDADLKNKLEKTNFFVCKWLVSDVANRYKISEELIEKLCKRFKLPIVGEGRDKFILLYKPNVFEHPITKKRALQINLFELQNLNKELQKAFMNDYKGKTWFWHRFVWRMPKFILKILEYIYIMFASFFYSPKDSINILKSKVNTFIAARKIISYAPFNKTKVGILFNDQETKDLAGILRKYYSSCIWQKGDILLVDNRKVVHAGMPGAGDRLVRAMICNPMDMNYSHEENGVFDCKERVTDTVGFYMASGQLADEAMDENLSLSN